MAPRHKQIAATLAGAVAIASGGATAGPASGHVPAPVRGAAAKTRAGSGSLAARIGVDARDLRNALEEAREETRRRDDGQTADLAMALGRPRSQVGAALAKLRGRRERGSATSLPSGLGTELGMDPATVARAIRETGDMSRERAGAERDRFASAVARKLGVPLRRVAAELPAPPA